MKTVRQSVERLAPMYEMIASESGERGSSGSRSCVDIQIISILPHHIILTLSLSLTLCFSL